MEEEEKSAFINEIIFTLQKHNYELREKIGKGGFASVYKCKNNKYNEIFCVKIIELPEDAKQTLSISFNSEFETLVKIIHPNIISVFDHFQSPHCLFLILEYCPNGSLYDLIAKSGAIERNRFIDLCHQILSAANYIHSIGIAHRDIKPQNILFDFHNRPKLADFGLAEFFNTNQKEKERFGGSLPYMAPELIKFQEFSPIAVDIWALGVTFFQMATGYLPWLSKKVETEIISGEVCFPSEMDDQISFFLRKMLQPDPSRRSSCQQLLELPIFSISNKENSQRLPPLAPMKPTSIFSPKPSSRYHDAISTSSQSSILIPQRTKRRRRITGSGSTIFYKKRVSLAFTFSGSGSNSPSNTNSENNNSDSLLK